MVDHQSRRSRQTAQPQLRFLAAATRELKRSPLALLVAGLSLVVSILALTISVADRSSPRLHVTGQSAEISDMLDGRIALEFIIQNLGNADAILRHIDIVFLDESGIRIPPLTLTGAPLRPDGRSGPAAIRMPQGAIKVIAPHAARMPKMAAVCLGYEGESGSPLYEIFTYVADVSIKYTDLPGFRLADEQETAALAEHISCRS